MTRRTRLQAEQYPKRSSSDDPTGSRHPRHASGTARRRRRRRGPFPFTSPAPIRSEGGTSSTGSPSASIRPGWTRQPAAQHQRAAESAAPRRHEPTAQRRPTQSTARQRTPAQDGPRSRSRARAGRAVPGHPSGQIRSWEQGTHSVTLPSTGPKHESGCQFQQVRAVEAHITSPWAGRTRGDVRPARFAACAAATGPVRRARAGRARARVARSSGPPRSTTYGAGQPHRSG